MDHDPERLILIVTGAHLLAEIGDRPAAYRLQHRMSQWFERRPGGPPGAAVVCSDLWYLNNDALRARPTVSVGGPAVNALTAFLGDKVPSAFAIQDVLLVQVDLDFVDLAACCWGTNPEATLAAVDAFCERYLDAFMAAATREW